MALASNVTLATVRGTFVDYQGNPIAGQVKFTMNTVLRNQLADQIIIPSTITVTLDTNGSFLTQLPISDDADLTPTGFTYAVEESFAGGRSYTLTFALSTSPLVPATYGGVNAAIASYAALKSGYATYAALKAASYPEPTFDLADVAPQGTFPHYISYVSAFTWADLSNTVQTLDVLVDQQNSSFNFFNPTYQQMQVKTYSAIKAGFATYAALKAGPLPISLTELQSFATAASNSAAAAQASLTAAQGSAVNAGTSATNAAASRDAALASQASSEAQLALMVAENDSRLDLALFGA